MRFLHGYWNPQEGSNGAGEHCMGEGIRRRGTFTPVADDTAGTVLKLSLGDVPEQILYFTDRPAQEAGFDSMGNVMDHVWPGVYGKIAPNALMKATMANQESSELFCVLDKPLYSAATARLGFTLTYIAGSQEPFPQLAVTDVKLIILNNAATDQIEWSQILTGDIGVFEPTATKWTYSFRIGNAIGSVFSYTSAPMRLLATLAAEDYIQDWQDRFGDTPPNASISYNADEYQKGGVQIVTLSNPVYDEQTGSICFTAKVLYGMPLIEEAGLTAGNPTIFVDGGKPDFEYCSGDDAAWCSPCCNAPDNTVNGANHALSIHLPGNAWAVQDGGQKVTSVGPNEGLHGDNNKNGIFPPGCTDGIQAVEGKIPCPDITGEDPACQKSRICNIYRGGVTGGTVEFVIGKKLN